MTDVCDCKFVIITVGLPGRGKTLMARNLSRYLRWLGIATKTFSVAKYRRAVLGAKLNADFFDPNNKDALDKRTVIANKALSDLIAWLEAGGQVAVLDATNIVKERRLLEYEKLRQHSINAVFLECIYEREDTIDQYMQELKFNCHPEYDDWEREEAVVDFMRRIAYYKVNYKSLAEDDPYPYVQYYGDVQRIETKDVSGYIPTKIVYYLMNSPINIRRCIYLLVDNDRRQDMDGRLTPLSSRAQGIHVDDFVKQNLDLQVWTGTNGCVQNDSIFERPQLDPMAEGEVNGMDDEQIKVLFPDDYDLHQRDSFGHRYPRAESYKDVTLRLEGIIMELEKTAAKVLIIAHESIIRCIYAYYVEIKPKDIPNLHLPPNRIIELRPHAYGCYESHYAMEAGFPNILDSVLRLYPEDIQN